MISYVAVEVSGHETPVLVGLSRNITCTAHVNVTRMEWMQEGVIQPIDRNEDGAKSLTLHLNPTDTRLNGSQFTCRISTGGLKKLSQLIFEVIVTYIKLAASIIKRTITDM